LEQAAAQGKTCNIVVAQPRRISAMSVAERVAAERGDRIGDTVNCCDCIILEDHIAQGMLCCVVSF